MPDPDREWRLRLPHPVLLGSTYASDLKTNLFN